MSNDVTLTDEEQRIIAEIQRYEGDLESRSPWTDVQAREGVRRDDLALAALVVAAVVLVAGPVANLELVPFVGIVIILLTGAARLNARISAMRWPSRMRTVLSSLRPGGPGEVA
jgi:hypothetical protein